MTGSGVGVRRSAALAGVLAAAMLVRTGGAGTLPTYGPLVFQFGTGTGQPEAAASADFNCDGKTDVVLIQHIFQSTTPFPIRIIGNNGSGGMVDISSQVITGTPPTVVGPRETLVDDFNGDGRPDVFVADYGKDAQPFPGAQNQLLLSTPDCHLVSATATHLPQQLATTHSTAAADVDADGDLDLYVGGTFGPPRIGPQIWLNDGTGRFSVAAGRLPSVVEEQYQGSYTSAGFADVDGDGDPDLVFGADDLSQSALALNDGTGRFSLLPGAIPAKPFAPNAIVLDIRDYDINRDGHTDLVLSVTKQVPYYQGRWLQILINNGDGTFHDETATRMPQSDNLNTWFIFVDLLDVDGDGNIDIVGKVPYHNSSGDHRFALSDANGVFTSVNLTPTGSGLSGAYSYVDVNNNGHRDLLTFGDVWTELQPNTGPVLPPGQPLGVRVSTTLPDRVRVFWRSVWAATQYEVWRSPTPGGVQVLVGTTATTTLDDLGASPTPMYYFVKSVNSAGTSVASTGVAGWTVTVPHITGPPLDRVVPLADSAQFSVVATGNPAPSFLWQVSTDGGGAWTDLTETAPYTGTATATLTVSAVTASVNGFRYRAIVSNSAGWTTSGSAKLSILAAPTVTAPPNRQIQIGGTASFEVTAGGNPAPTLQWQLSSNGGASWLNLTPDATYGGTNTPTLTVSNAPAGFNGAKFRCIATSIAGSVTSAVATLTVGAVAPPPPPPSPLTLNLSHDLVTNGIAAQNVVPDTPSLDARPLFASALAWAAQHNITSVTVDPGSYYFLSSDQSDRYLNLAGLADLTIDLAGSTIFLKTGFLHGVILTECARVTLKNVTIDYVTPPYTHAAITSVNAAGRTIGYSTLAGFADPASFNNVSSPYGPLDRWVVVFRNGAIVPGTSRMHVQSISSGVVQLTGDALPWLQPATLGTLRAGDTIVLAPRGGGSPVEIFRGDAIVVSNVTVHGSSSPAVAFDQMTNSTADAVRVVPRPGTGLLGSNAEGIRFTSSRQNNQIKNATVKRTLDDAITMDSLNLAMVLSQSDPRHLRVRRNAWWRFPNGTSVNFVKADTTPEWGGGVIVSQNPPDADAFNADIDLTLDRDVLALTAGDYMVFGTASARGAGSKIADNVVSDIPFGRGIWLGGNQGVTIERNQVSGTSGGGIVIAQATGGPFVPPVSNIVVQDNQITGVLGPMASGHASHGAFAGIVVHSLDRNGNFAHATSNHSVTVRRNTVTDSGRGGIWLGQTDGAAIENNTVVRWNRFPNLPVAGLDQEASAFAAEDFSKAIAVRLSANVTQTGNTTTGDPGGSSIALDRSEMRFGATSNGITLVAVTPAQNLRVLVNTPTPLAWTATSNQSWLRVLPESGVGTSTLSVSILPSAALLPGVFQGTISIAPAGGGGPAKSVTVTLSALALGATASPFGSFDTPLEGTTGVTGSIAVTGWALDDVGVTAVRIMRDPVGTESPGQLVFIGNAVFVEGARPDVVAVHASLPANGRAGWGYMMLTNFLPDQGHGTFKLHAIADDADGHSTSLGTKTITCANATSTTPFGAIDTPGQGETVSGLLNNFGWTLIRGSARADIPGGGSVQVFVDGAPVGSPAGWASRPDLTAVFPTGFSSLDSTLAVFPIDTTTLANGVHTIAWVVTATNGQTAGIGSRYFTVSNASLVAAGPAAVEVRPSDALPRTPEPAVPGTVLARRGFNLETAYASQVGDADGVIVVQSEELDRIDLRTGAERAVLLSSEGPAALPTGSRFDAETGRFTWLPGVGFVGAYDFLFDRQRVRIVLNPQGSVGAGETSRRDQHP